MRLRRLPGRRRQRLHLLLLVLVGLLGWAWFGLSGAVPCIIWWWQRRPPAALADAWWSIPLERVRSAQLGPWRVLISYRGRRTDWIYFDELSEDDLARLRRTLKYQLAAGFSTSSRSEKPGNRMVSSERASRSG